MKLFYTDHVITRLAERGISKSEAASTVLFPDAVRFSFNNRKRYIKKFSRGLLEVVCLTSKSNAIVITAYFIEMYEDNL